MRSVKFVPADAQAREQYPRRALIVKTCAHPFRGDAKRKRQMTNPEADRAAIQNGWVRLSDLPPAQRRAWLANFRSMAPAGEHVRSKVATT